VKDLKIPEKGDRDDRTRCRVLCDLVGFFRFACCTLLDVVASSSREGEDENGWGRCTAVYVLMMLCYFIEVGLG